MNVLQLNIHQLLGRVKENPIAVLEHCEAIDPATTTCGLAITDLFLFSAELENQLKRGNFFEDKNNKFRWITFNKKIDVLKLNILRTDFVQQLQRLTIEKQLSIIIALILRSKSEPINPILPQEWLHIFNFLQQANIDKQNYISRSEVISELTKLQSIIQNNIQSIVENLLEQLNGPDVDAVFATLLSIVTHADTQQDLFYNLFVKINQFTVPRTIINQYTDSQFKSYLKLKNIALLGLNYRHSIGDIMSLFREAMENNNAAALHALTFSINRCFLLSETDVRDLSLIIRQRLAQPDNIVSAELKTTLRQILANSLRHLIFSKIHRDKYRPVHNAMTAYSVVASPLSAMNVRLDLAQIIQILHEYSGERFTWQQRNEPVITLFSHLTKTAHTTQPQANYFLYICCRDNPMIIDMLVRTNELQHACRDAGYWLWLSALQGYVPALDEIQQDFLLGQRRYQPPTDLSNYPIHDFQIAYTFLEALFERGIYKDQLLDAKNGLAIKLIQRQIASANQPGIIALTDSQFACLYYRLGQAAMAHEQSLAANFFHFIVRWQNYPTALRLSANLDLYLMAKTYPNKPGLQQPQIYRSAILDLWRTTDQAKYLTTSLTSTDTSWPDTIATVPNRTAVTTRTLESTEVMTYVIDFQNLQRLAQQGKNVPNPLFKYAFAGIAGAGLLAWYFLFVRHNENRHGSLRKSGREFVPAFFIYLVLFVFIFIRALRARNRQIEQLQQQFSEEYFNMPLDRNFALNSDNVLVPKSNGEIAKNISYDTDYLAIVVAEMEKAVRDENPAATPASAPSLAATSSSSSKQRPLFADYQAQLATLPSFSAPTATPVSASLKTEQNKKFN